MARLFFHRQKGLVCFFERKYCDLRPDMEIMSDLQKVARILASHIGHTTDLPLAPKLFVIVKGRHLIEVNCVDCHYASLTQTSQRTYHNFSAGSERDGTVEVDRRFLVFFANPGGTERARQGSMRFASSHNIDFTVPGLQNGNRQARGASKTKKSNPLSPLHARNPQAAKANDARTQQGRDMHVIQTSGQRKSEICARKGILGVASVHRVSRKCRAITQIFHAVMAVPAITIDAAHPRNTGSRSHRQLCCRTFDYLSHDLMTRNELRSKRRQIFFYDVQVSPTHSACDDPKQKMPGFELWTWDILDVKERSRRCTL